MAKSSRNHTNLDCLNEEESMARIGIYYGSDTGNTEAAAKQIHQAFGDEAAEPKSIADATAEELAGYDGLILGTSTWGAGDLQDDWDAALSTLESADLSGKKVAIFGLGDQDGYPDTFVDGIGTLAAAARKAGAQVIGSVPTKGYNFDASTAVEDGAFVGLPLDDDNQSNLTAERITSWVAALKSELA
jgi:flavodoxin I